MTAELERKIEADYRRRLAAGEFGPYLSEDAARRASEGAAKLRERAEARDAAMLERAARMVIADRDRMTERMARSAAIICKSARLDVSKLDPGAFAQSKIGA